jgi:hypothetical protein
VNAADAPARTPTGSMPVGVGQGELLAVARRLVGASEGATWWRGQDLVAVARAADIAAPLPDLDEDCEEPRLAALVMAAAGFGIEETAARLGSYSRQVSRWREAAEADRA